jgi:hypothetical protein
LPPLLDFIADIGILVAILLAAKILIPRRKYVIFCLVAGGLLAVVMGQDLPKFYRLYNAGTETRGSVQQTTCDNHGYVFYSFKAGQKSYSNQMRASSGGIACSTLGPGADITVVYLADEPEVSTAGNPWVGLMDIVLTIFVAALVGPLFIIYIYRRSQRNQGGGLESD